MDVAPDRTDPHAVQGEETHFEPFEMRLFRLSPFGPVATAPGLVLAICGRHVLTADRPVTGACVSEKLADPFVAGGGS